MVEVISNNAAQTERAGYNLGKSLKSGDFIALFGEMGTGKTTFIKGLAEGLGIIDFVSSPTFSLVHEYNGNIPLFHFDMYRINTWEDLNSTAYFDYLDSNGVIAVEWSENIENALPDNHIRVEIVHGVHFEQRRIFITEVTRLENACN